MSTGRKRSGSRNGKLDGLISSSSLKRDDTGDSGVESNLGSWFLAPTPQKRWAETFFLFYSLVWVSWFGAIVVFQAYESFGAWHYMLVGLGMALPVFLLPLAADEFGPAWAKSPDAGKPLHMRYWVKANLWIFVISYIGNIHWTHYFYNLLGADYSFPAHRLNNVPVALIFCTHAYFATYFVISNFALRGARSWARHGLGLGSWGQLAVVAVVTAGLSWVTGFIETVTISSFPYYRIENRAYMYTVGCVCYGLYFIVAFPAFLQIDEHSTGGAGEEGSSSSARQGRREREEADATNKVALAGGRAQRGWTLAETLQSSLAACMAVTVLLEVWRYTIGGLGGRGKDAGTFCM